jgi:hypothetical protein
MMKDRHQPNLLEYVRVFKIHNSKWASVGRLKKAGEPPANLVGHPQPGDAWPLRRTTYLAAF